MPGRAFFSRFSPVVSRVFPRFLDGLRGPRASRTAPACGCSASACAFADQHRETPDPSDRPTTASGVRV